MKAEQPAIDQFSRTIDYLRISLTDRCNLRCRYCMPRGGGEHVSHDEILRYEELLQLAAVFYRFGIRKWRLTGGEPLIKSNLGFLIRGLYDIGPRVKLALTTNGLLLLSQLEELISNGISRINISLDTLRADRFEYLTRGGQLAGVLEAIEAALACQIDPLRLNVIIFKDYNEDEILDFAQLAVEKPIYVRFIEYMPLGQKSFYSRFGGINGSFIKERISGAIPLTEIPSGENTPADYYQPAGGLGRIGFINPMSHAFCQSCNRLRLNSVGGLRPCLFSRQEYNLKEPLRANNLEEVTRLIELAIHSKPEGYTLPGTKEEQQPMSSIGG